MIHRHKKQLSKQADTRGAFQISALSVSTENASTSPFDACAPFSCAALSTLVAAEVGNGGSCISDDKRDVKKSLQRSKINTLGWLRLTPDVVEITDAG